MRVFVCMCVVSSVFITLAFHLAHAAAPSSAASSPSSQEWSGDVGPNLVASLYKVLLQEKPPTLEQEKALFDDAWGLRGDLIARGVGAETEAVFLQYCWKHKDLFLPKNVKAPAQVLARISVTSTFDYVGNLERIDYTRLRKGQGFVMVVFVDDQPGKVAQSRSIIFSLINNKLDPNLICFDGFSGKKMSDVLDEEFLKLTPQQLEELKRSGK